ncbi:MAG: NAD(P)H-binding protein [Bryobacteraceae bacterium]|nr:NAD(P)H-binding protein [Bryobacteraceae bacterium]
MSEISRVLAVGAGGEFAGLVVPELSRRGVKVRGLVSKADKEAAVRAQGAAETVVGDLRSAEQVAAALAGMDAAFYIAPFALENEAEVGKRFIELAKEAGVRVVSSVLCKRILE